MPIISFFFNIQLLFTLFGLREDAFYQSNTLRGLNLQPVAGEYYILDDVGEEVEVKRMEDEDGLLYWYRRKFTPVCLTGECKMVDVGLYWYCTGEFLGIEVYREHLTKTDHSIFSEDDYDKLISVLSNDWSSLREYEFTDLVDESAEGVDGTSGATKREIAEESVDNAVYTTYTLWHLIHVGEKEQLVQRTSELLNQGNLILQLLQEKDKRYQYFILDLFSRGKIHESEPLVALLIEGLKTKNDLTLKDLAIKSLSHVDVNQPHFQEELAIIYPQAAMNEKLQILSALKRAKQLNKDLYKALGTDLGIENEWFSIKLLDVLKQESNPSDELITAANKLMGSDNPMVKKAVIDFIGSNK